jgi:hypothetical protein
MNFKRMTAGAMGAALAVLILVGLGVPAQAVSQRASGVPAARDGQPSIAAASPGISPPPADVWYIPNATDYACPSRYACFAVYDPTVGMYKVFLLYYCGRYTVYNWYHWGSLRNSQVGNAHVRLYDRNGWQIGPAYPPDGLAKYVDWTPVYFVRPC